MSIVKRVVSLIDALIVRYDDRPDGSSSPVYARYDSPPFVPADSPLDLMGDDRAHDAAYSALEKLVKRGRAREGMDAGDVIGVESYGGRSADRLGASVGARMECIVEGWPVILSYQISCVAPSTMDKKLHPKETQSSTRARPQISAAQRTERIKEALRQRGQ